jgi:hypothetical protein
MSRHNSNLRMLSFDVNCDNIRPRFESGVPYLDLPVLLGLLHRRLSVVMMVFARL